MCKWLWTLVPPMFLLVAACSDLPMEGHRSGPDLDAADTEAVNAVLPEPVEVGTVSTICQALEGHHQRTLMEAAAGADPALDERAVKMEALITNLCR